MRCDQYRESASARLDGEDPGLPDVALDAHLAGCGDCAGWYAAAWRVTRLARVAPAEPVPDLTAAVLAAVGPLRRRIRPGELLVRAGLGLLAAAQLLLALPELAGHDALAHSVHAAHETGAWNAALAVAVGWVAVRPRHAAGLQPLLAAFAAVLTAMSVGDLRAGRMDPARGATHGLVWCAVALIAALLWVRRQPGPGLGGHGGRLPRADSTDPAERTDRARALADAGKPDGPAGVLGPTGLPGPAAAHRPGPAPGLAGAPGAAGSAGPPEPAFPEPAAGRAGTAA
jgi:predicted anti-sigma-YlaC factor YlaD